MAGKLPDRLQDLLDAFELMDDRQERIESLIGMSDRFKPVPESIATRPYPEESRVPHCESEAFVFVEPLPDGTLKYHIAVDNPQGISAMAMAVILDETASGQPLERVAAIDGDVVYAIFGRELSMGKTMGLMGMVSMVQNAAKRRLAAA